MLNRRKNRVARAIVTVGLRDGKEERKIIPNEKDTREICNRKRYVGIRYCNSMVLINIHRETRDYFFPPRGVILEIFIKESF